jgi:FkbM family methyltransferase
MNQEQLQNHLRNLSNQTFPSSHVNYLEKLKSDFNIYPKVIYDIGACVLEWKKVAENIWPDSKIYAFEAMDTVEFLYKEHGIDYHLGVLSDVDDKEITFYQSNVSPGGNSYYQENSWARDVYYNNDSKRLLKSYTVDTVVKNKNFQYADLIKIDVQGCEVDVLKGMTETLKYCEHLIIELQHTHYNEGAPLSEESVPFIESLGFELITPLFSNNGPDGDYHFKKIK